MRKFITTVLVLAVSITMSVSIAYAWYVVVFSGKLTASGIKPAEPATNILQLADQNEGTYSADLTVTASSELYPCTVSGDGWVNDISEDVSNSASYVFKKTFYLKSSSKFDCVRISSVTLAGAGKSDEINKSLRVMFIKDEDRITYNPSGANDYTQTFNGTKTGSNVITMCVWYEGTDASNTSANALASTGEVQIQVVMEAQ